MKIHADDEAFLVSRMSDVSVATMLNWSLARVERARAWLKENSQPVSEDAAAARNSEHVENVPELRIEPSDVREGVVLALREGGGGPEPADHAPDEPPGRETDRAAESEADPNLIGKALPVTEILDPKGWIGAPVVEAQIDLEEAIAAKAGPHGSPPGLSAAGLAAWLVDNSTLEFAEIAATAGVPLGQVQAIADDEPWPLEPKKTAVRAPKPPKVQSQPPTPKPPPAPRNPAVASTQSEIPPRVVRWAGFFIDARWRIGDVAGLFDCNPADFAAALGR